MAVSLCLSGCNGILESVAPGCLQLNVIQVIEQTVLLAYGLTMVRVVVDLTLIQILLDIGPLG